MTGPRHARIESPWLQMAADDACEWFREHPRADLAAYVAWCEAYELEQVLAAGYGWRPGDRVTRQMQEALDAAVVGLQAAREVEVARRAARGAAGRVRDWAGARWDGAA